MGVIGIMGVMGAFSPAHPITGYPLGAPASSASGGSYFKHRPAGEEVVAAYGLIAAQNDEVRTEVSIRFGAQCQRMFAARKTGNARKDGLAALSAAAPRGLIVDQDIGCFRAAASRAPAKDGI